MTGNKQGLFNKESIMKQVRSLIAGALVLMIVPTTGTSPLAYDLIIVGLATLNFILAVTINNRRV